MIIKGLIDEDLVNYKVPSMIIEFPYCSFKCDKECGMDVCQNSMLVKSEDIEISIPKLIMRYIKNDLSKAVVMQGLEPFDSFEDLYKFITEFRKLRSDDIVIYTGYTKEELVEKNYLCVLQLFPNIIIKYGRFIPNKEHHYDEILGVTLASDNQYAEKVS